MKALELMTNSELLNEYSTAYAAIDSLKRGTKRCAAAVSHCVDVKEEIESRRMDRVADVHDSADVARRAALIRADTGIHPIQVIRVRHDGRTTGMLGMQPGDSDETVEAMRKKCAALLSGVEDADYFVRDRGTVVSARYLDARRDPVTGLFRP